MEKSPLTFFPGRGKKCHPAVTLQVREERTLLERLERRDFTRVSSAREQFTWYSSISGVDSGGLKVHCCRTISFTESQSSTQPSTGVVIFDSDVSEAQHRHLISIGIAESQVLRGQAVASQLLHWRGIVRGVSVSPIEVPPLKHTSNLRGGQMHFHPVNSVWFGSAVPVLSG